MSDSNNCTFTLKAVINKLKTKVLLAEVDNNFADVLLGFSMQPFGLIVQALQKHYGEKMPVIGSLNNLYNGLTKLSSVNYNIRRNLVNPVTAYAFPFGFTDDYFFSQPWNWALEDEYFWVLEIFSQSNTSFIICDDLRIVANESGSIFETLNSVGVAIADMDGVETRTVTLGVNEIMDFLVLSLISPRPLSDTILVSAVTAELAKPGISLPHIQKDSTSKDHKEMINLKLMMLKSTNKLLFAQAGCDFVNYLFTMLEIPLGRVDGHLGGDTCLNNIGTLYRSLTALARKYFSVSDTTPAETNFPLRKVFVDGMYYMVNDDLTVTRLSVVSCISLLDELKMSLSDVEEIELQIGLEEVFGILKASLTSTRALTDGLINPRLKRQLKLKREN